MKPVSFWLCLLLTASLAAGAFSHPKPGRPRPRPRPHAPRVLGKCTGADIKRFALKFNGKVQIKGQPNFDPYAVLWNKFMKGSGKNVAWKADIPTLIVHPTSDSDAQKVVRLAIKCGVKVSPLSGGHAYGGTSLISGIVMVLTAWKKIKVDVAKKTAVIQPGVKSGEMLDALKDKGLFFPVGHCSDVGLAGYLLGGGSGWNLKTYGISSDSIISVKAVDLRNGRIVRVSHKSFPDLFWGLKGAGLRLGIVLEFKLQLYSYPYDKFFRSSAIFTGKKIKPAMRWYREWEKNASNSVEANVVLTHVPPVSKGISLIIPMTAFYPLDNHTQASLKALKDYAATHAAVYQEGEIPYDNKTIFENFDLSLNQPDTALYTKYRMYRDLSNGLIDAYVKCANKMPSGRCLSWFFKYGNAKGTPGGGSVSGVYDNLYIGGTDGIFTRTVNGSSGDEDLKYVKWVRDCAKSFEPFVVKPISVPVNGHMWDEKRSDERIWSKDILAKLKKIKAKYDPHGVVQNFGFYKLQITNVK